MSYLLYVVLAYNTGVNVTLSLDNLTYGQCHSVLKNYVDVFTNDPDYVILEAQCNKVTGI